MDSNVIAFLKTRKFWALVIALLETIVVFAIPELFHIPVDVEAQATIIKILWGIAGLIVGGDIGYDWISLRSVSGFANKDTP